MEDLFRIPLGFLVSVSALSPDSLWDLFPGADHSRQIYEQRDEAKQSQPFETGELCLGASHLGLPIQGCTLDLWPPHSLGAAVFCVWKRFCCHLSQKALRQT